LTKKNQKVKAPPSFAINCGFHYERNQSRFGCNFFLSFNFLIVQPHSLVATRQGLISQGGNENLVYGRKSGRCRRKALRRQKKRLLADYSM